MLFLCQGSRPGQFLVDEEHDPNIDEERGHCLVGRSRTLKSPVVGGSVPSVVVLRKVWSSNILKVGGHCPQISDSSKARVLTSNTPTFLYCSLLTVLEIPRFLLRTVPWFRYGGPRTQGSFINVSFYYSGGHSSGGHSGRLFYPGHGLFWVERSIWVGGKIFSGWRDQSGGNILALGR